MSNRQAFSFLAIGKTQESKEASEGFKRYVGLASSYVLAVNPTKAELDELRGFESQGEPEYVKSTDEGKEVHVNFLVKTDPAANNGIEITNLLMFTLRNTPAYNNDKTKVQVIDDYGNATWADAEDAKNHKQLPTTARIDQTSYRMAANGEADLVAFLKTYLNVPNSLDYINGEWVMSDLAGDGLFKLEHIKDYFNGDFSELKDALNLQPNNKVKLLYGVRTTDDGKQYQAIAARDGLFTYNSAGSRILEKMDKRLTEMKQRGSYANTDFRICELQEYTIQPTDLGTAPASSDDEMPFPTSLDSAPEAPWLS